MVYKDGRVEIKNERPGNTKGSSKGLWGERDTMAVWQHSCWDFSKANPDLMRRLRASTEWDYPRWLAHASTLTTCTGLRLGWAWRDQYREWKSVRTRGLRHFQPRDDYGCHSPPKSNTKLVCLVVLSSFLLPCWPQTGIGSFSWGKPRKERQVYPSIASKLLGEALICNLGPGWVVRNSWSLWRFGLSRKALPVPHVNGAGLFPKLVRTVLAFPNSKAKRGLLSC